MKIKPSFSFAMAASFLALTACDDNAAATHTPDADVEEVSADTTTPDATTTPIDTTTLDDTATPEDTTTPEVIADTTSPEDTTVTDTTAPSDTTSNAAADQLIAQGEADFFRALGGETNLRSQAILELSTGLSMTPDNARGQLMYGMALLSSVAEDGNVFAALSAQPALEKAAALAPEDLRIPGWIGTVKVGAARALNSGVDEAVQYMIDAADLFPEFNNVSLAIAFGHFGLDTPYPQMAIDRLLAIGDCATNLDVCRNTDKVPHNVEGAMMLYGDLYARVGDAAKARSYYQLALATPDAATWHYADDARAVLDALDSRIALYLDSDPANDPQFFSEGKVACVACYQK